MEPVELARASRPTVATVACCPECGQALKRPRPFEIDFGAGMARFRDREVYLARRRILALEALNSVFPRSLMKEQLLDKVFGNDLMDLEDPESTLESYLSTIRRAFREAGIAVSIVSVRNLGYRLQVDSV